MASSPDILKSSTGSTVSSPSGTVLASPQHHHLKSLSHQDSLDSDEQPAEPPVDPKPRPSISTAVIESICFNFRDGSLDSHGAFKALNGGITPSSTSSSVKTLSFHSEKELEDFIDGRHETEDLEDAPYALAPPPAGAGGAGAEASAQTKGKGSTLRSMWSATLGRRTTAPAGAPAAATNPPPPAAKQAIPPPPKEAMAQCQGDLEFEDRNGKFKTRSWVLTGTAMGYHKRQATISLKSGGVRFETMIDLKDVVQVYHDHSCFLMDENCFAVDTGKKKHFFKCGSRAEMVSWMVNIAKQKRRSGSFA